MAENTERTEPEERAEGEAGTGGAAKPAGKGASGAGKKPAGKGAAGAGKKTAGKGAGGGRARKAPAGKAASGGKASPRGDALEKYCFAAAIALGAAGALWFLWLCLFPYARDLTADGFADPGLYQSNGRATAENLRLNIIPEMLRKRNITLPHRIDEDLTLEEVTAGPGSTLGLRFAVSPRFAADPDPAGTVKYMCRSRFIREEILKVADYFRITYVLDGKPFAELEITAETCADA